MPQDYFGTERFDDEKLPPETLLLRQCRTPVQVVPCETRGWRISSQAYAPKKGEAGVSIDLFCLMEKAGLEIDARYGLMPNTKALLSVTATGARAHSAGVAYTPKPAQPDLEGYAALPNEFHGEIITPVSPKQSRRLTDASTVVVSDFE